jgi:hypothetical protein
MHHKPYYGQPEMYDPPRIKKLPNKKSRHMKYRPLTPGDWEDLDY